MTIEIVLSHPQIPENTGFVARSMKAFGFRELTLVAPEFEWGPQSPAYKTASGAAAILDGARVCESVEEAVAACHHVVGFSRRTHDFDRPRFELVSWAETVDSSRRTALVFGAEDFGLFNAEKQLCHSLVTIPMQEETLSLNLAHAVTVVLYELTRTQQPASPNTGPVPASHADVQRAVERLTSILSETNFFKAGRRDRQIETIRNLVQRLSLTSDEYHTVMGLLGAFQRNKKTNHS